MQKINFHILTFLANKLIKTYLKSAVIASALLVVIWFVVLNKIEITMQNMSQKSDEYKYNVFRGRVIQTWKYFHSTERNWKKKNLLVTQPMGAQSETTEPFVTYYQRKTCNFHFSFISCISKVFAMSHLWNQEKQTIQDWDMFSK